VLLDWKVGLRTVVIRVDGLRIAVDPISDGQAFQVLGREAEVVSLSHHCVNPPPRSWLYPLVSRPCFPSSRVVEEQGVKALAFDHVGFEEPGKERQAADAQAVAAVGDEP
jgi:hypothetical protein